MFPQLQSLYVPMPDGVRLAVDVSLPATAPGARLPTVLEADRYWRSRAYADSFQLLPANGNATYTIGHGGPTPSADQLPVIG